MNKEKQYSLKYGRLLKQLFLELVNFTDLLQSNYYFINQATCTCSRRELKLNKYQDATLYTANEFIPSTSALTLSTIKLDIGFINLYLELTCIYLIKVLSLLILSNKALQLLHVLLIQKHGNTVTQITLTNTRIIMNIVYVLINQKFNENYILNKEHHANINLVD
ncbi:unnamed protein product [Paramecium sonneborni]|uniref:Transmembrane protein n=1 Tax=Paramecium sonneborni TaxID=65129 RepID=A0A8S1R9Y4_9CILI|nr:unnamed protein product [Paramecium sonneborni]